MGSLFRRLLGDAGVTVLHSDVATTLSNVEVATRCDLTLIAVPLRLTPSVLAEVAPHVPADRALVSLASLMEPALPAVTSGAGAACLLHPLFGPGRKSLSGATFAYAPVHGGPWLDWLMAWLQAQDATIVTTCAQEHDRAMAVVQALLHATTAALAPLLARALPDGQPLDWTTPTMRAHLALMSRILQHDPNLYAELLALNRHTPHVIDLLIARLAAVRAAAEHGPDAVRMVFTGARDELGPLGPVLAAEGNRLLDEA
jgi:prephenate dehydrogenase